MRMFLIGMVLLFLTTTGKAHYAGTSYADTAGVEQSDSLRRVKEADSLISSNRWYGALGYLPIDLSGAITKSQRRTVQHQTLGELLIRGTPFQPLSQGGYGQFDGISMYGGMPNQMGVSFNGRMVLSNWNSSINLSTIAPEGAEQVEMLSGSSALGLVPSLTQTAVNIQEIRFDTRTPFIAMWYSQGAGDLVAADVTFAQNIAPGVNVNVGIRRAGANGRYQRTVFDVWNVRVGTRYAVDKRTTIGFNYTLTSHNTDLWGGIRDPLTLSNYTEATAAPMYVDLRDHERRHDVTVGLDHLLTQDSAHSISSTLYFTRDAMFRTQDTSIISDHLTSTPLVRYFGSNYGLLFRSKHRFNHTLLRFTMGAEHVRNDSNAFVQRVNELQPRAMVHVAQNISDSTYVQAAAQYVHMYGSSYFGIGGGLTYASNSVRSRLDVSYMLQPPALTARQNLLPAKSLLCLFELSYNSGPFTLNGQTFVRTTHDYLLNQTVSDSNKQILHVTTINGGIQQLAGVVFEGRYQKGWVEASTAIRAHQQIRGLTELPAFMGSISFGGVYQIGNNSIRGSVQFTAVAPGISTAFSPLNWQYILGDHQTTQWGLNGVNLNASAVVGNATIKASFENILGQQWSTVYGYPMITRDFRLTVNWSFFD